MEPSSQEWHLVSIAALVSASSADSVESEESQVQSDLLQQAIGQLIPAVFGAL
jgi:hypothetical protein